MPNKHYVNYSKRPRHINSTCVECDAPLGKRARHGIQGRWFCNKHGQASQSYARYWLHRQCPELAILFSERPMTKWIVQWVCEDIANALTRFPGARKQWLVRDVMPYYLSDPNDSVPRKTEDLEKATHCAVKACRIPLAPRCYHWGNETVCVACWFRLKRQHTVAAKRFNTLLSLTRNPKYWWLPQLLDPKLRARLKKHSGTAMTAAHRIQRGSHFV